ncbi:MAG: tRNA lysidine(34) synthetase TilS [Desulfosalsimonadaceae bacterium]
MTHRLFRNMRATVHYFGMLKGCDTVLIAVSGGPDSVCLLHALLLLSRQIKLRIAVAHLNHGLRAADGESDAEFVEQLAKHYRLAFFHKAVDIRAAAAESGTSLEEAGRMHRYNFLQETAAREGFEKIAVGHNSDDNAELLLINLLRGSGPSGLGGIPPVRGNIVRPLIRAGRSQIIEYLTDNRICFRTDHSNTDPAFLRNRIRHELLPMLKENYNPRIRETLNRTAEIFRQEKQWLNGLTRETLEQAVFSFQDRELALSVAYLEQLHTALLRRVIRAGIKTVKGDLRRISYAQIEAALELSKNQGASAAIDLPERIRVEKKNEQLIIRRAPRPLRQCHGRSPQPVYRHFISIQNLPVKLWIPEISRFLQLRLWPAGSRPDFSVHAGPWTAFFDMDCLRSELCVRNPENGDRIQPLGMKGSQKIKECLINNKVPKEKRPMHPVILSGETIIWLAGLRPSENARVRESTRRILQARLSPGSEDFHP